MAAAQSVSQAIAAVAAVEAEQNLHRGRASHLTGMLDDAREKATAAELQLGATTKEVTLPPLEHRPRSPQHLSPQHLLSTVFKTSMVAESLCSLLR